MSTPQTCSITVRLLIPTTTLIEDPERTDNREILNRFMDHCEMIQTGAREIPADQIVDVEIDDFD